ncbi:MAG TPA: CsbD family protein [Anaerolineae bacterium]|nr:CsbD family protein [Anaerolineae bacterium]
MAGHTGHGDILEGKWKQLRGSIKTTWGKLTDDDLDRISGKRDQLEGMLQEKYGYAKERARTEIDQFLNEQEREMGARP